MLKRIVGVLIASWAIGAEAGPIVFTSLQFSTEAVASAAGQADVDFGSSPPSALPLVSEATVATPAAFASGSGIATTGLLTTQAETSAGSGIASAAGTGAIVASFMQADVGTLLRLVFGSQNFTDPIAFSAASVFLFVTAPGLVPINRVFTAPGMFDVLVVVPLGTPVSVELLLSSEASLTSGGNAFNFASAGFSAFSVVEPSTLLLFALATLFVAGFRKRV